MSQANEPAIKIDNVSKTFILPHEKNTSIKSSFINFYRRNKSFESQVALEGISFEINKGEFFGIVGRNGSGKSTLLKTIAGIYQPTQGSVQVNGSLTPFIELGVGFNDELTGRENVYLNGALLGFNRKEMQKMYQDIVDFAELERFMDQKLKNYSSGMQVRLAFSIAVRARSDILLLDEVLAVGDTAFQRKCYRYFEDLKNSGNTVVLVTHSMSVVQRFCQRAVLLEEGKLIKQGAAQEIADEYNSLNIQTHEGGRPVLSSRNESIKIEILEQNKKSVTFKMEHQEKDKKPFYFGFSVIKDGATFAELNSLDSEKAKITNKSLIYELDTSKFNAGTYEISATLFKVKDKDPVAYTGMRPQFVITGADQNRGGAIRLEDSWKN